MLLLLLLLLVLAVVLGLLVLLVAPILLLVLVVVLAGSQYRPEHPRRTRNTIHLYTLCILARLWQTEYVKFPLVLLAGIRAGRALRSSNHVQAPFVNPSRLKCE